MFTIVCRFILRSRPLFLALLLIPSIALSATPKVVTSIYPLKLITDELLQGVTSSSALLDVNQSPHHFQFKPSQLRTATTADLVIWIDDEFESGMQKLNQLLQDKVNRLPLLKNLSTKTLIESDSDEHHGETGNQHRHHTRYDGHLWLSPEMVTHIGRLISEKLQQIDPAHEDQYRHNLQQLESKMQASLSALQSLTGQPGISYMAEHDFLRYLERSLNLVHQPVISNVVDYAGNSLRHVRQLQQQLTDNPVDCLLINRKPGSRMTQQLAKEFQLPVVDLNLLGTAEITSIKAYFDQLERQLLHCSKPLDK